MMSALKYILLVLILICSVESITLFTIYKKSSGTMNMPDITNTTPFENTHKRYDDSVLVVIKGHESKEDSLKKEFVRISDNYKSSLYYFSNQYDKTHEKIIHLSSDGIDSMFKPFLPKDSRNK